MVTETWFNDCIISSIENYKCYRKDRGGLNNGGGVCIYVHDEIKSSEVHNAQLTKRELVEQIS